MLNPLKHLNEGHKDCFKTEFPLAIREQLFQTWAEDLHDHDVVVSLDNCPFHLGNSFFCVSKTYFLSTASKAWPHRESEDALSCLIQSSMLLLPQF